MHKYEVMEDESEMKTSVLFESLSSTVPYDNNNICSLSSLVAPVPCVSSANRGVVEWRAGVNIWREGEAVGGG